MKRTLDLVLAHVNHRRRVNRCSIWSEYSHSWRYDAILTCRSEEEDHLESRLGRVECDRARFSGPDRSRFTLIAMRDLSAAPGEPITFQYDKPANLGLRGVHESYT